MTTDTVRHILWFLVLVTSQVLVFNNIGFLGLINPFPYIYLLLIMPDTFKGFGAMSMGFLIGLTVDMFMDTGGMHASACTMLVFVRPFILQNIASIDGYGEAMIPSAKQQGFSWFVSYAAILAGLHHLWLFYFEIFRTDEFFQTFFRAAGSWFFTLIIVIVIQIFSERNSAR